MVLKAPLPEEEQQALARVARDDPEARSKLIEHNLRLVYWTAKQYHWYGRTEIEDLFQLGVLGLMEAIEKYEPDRGAKFSTVAIWYMRSSISRNMFQFTDDVSLDTPIGDDEDTTLEDILYDKSSMPLEDEVIGKVSMEGFKNSIKAQLTPLQYNIIVLYYGIDCAELTFKEIAERYGKTPQEVRRERDRALRVIRRSVHEANLKREVDERIPFLRSVDYSQPKVTGGKMVSPVETTVLQRERIAEKLLENKRYMRDAKY